MTIVEFIGARLREDERTANLPWQVDPGGLRRCVMIRAMMGHAQEARQLDICVEIDRGVGTRTDPWIDELMYRDIAAYWNTHPDYRQEWT